MLIAARVVGRIVQNVLIVVIHEESGLSLEMAGGNTECISSKRTDILKQEISIFLCSGQGNYSVLAVG